MGFSLFHLLEAALLVFNGLAILHEQRFLKIYRLDKPSFSDPGPRNQVSTFLYALRTYMKAPLIIANLFFIAFEMVASSMPLPVSCIFDLDGTLLDYEPLSAEAFSRALSPLDGNFNQALHSEIVGTRADFWSEHVLTRNGVSPDVCTPVAFSERYHEEMEGLYGQIQPMRGAQTILASLQSHGVKLAIATSSIKSSFEKKMKHHEDLLRYFDVIVCGDDSEVPNGKPAPDIFLKAAERLGVRHSSGSRGSSEDLSHCVVFEDSPFGVQAGRAAGMRVVAIPDPRYQPLPFDSEKMRKSMLEKGAHVVVSSLDEVDLDWILSCNGAPAN